MYYVYFYFSDDYIKWINVMIQNFYFKLYFLNLFYKTYLKSIIDCFFILSLNLLLAILQYSSKSLNNV